MAGDHLTERQLRRLVTFIEGEVGIRLPPAKRVMVESRLRRRVRALQLPDLATYGRTILEADTIPQEELIHLIDCVTTNKTDFFREPAHFDYLRETIVPELSRLRDCRRAPVKVWSAASSTGAEAYTIAMLLHDMALASPFGFEITGTDISTDVLAQARRAVYSAEMIRPIPAPLRKRYTMRAKDPGRGEFRIIPELRRVMRWARLNLMDATYPLADDFDVIFCRNVLIYFDRDVQEQVLARLSRHLRPGGYLFVGHSESMAGHGRSGMVQAVPTVYRSVQKARIAA
jgi:chemotaxis protein methyltransferase CheR